MTVTLNLHLQDVAEQSKQIDKHDLFRHVSIFGFFTGDYLSFLPSILNKIVVWVLNAPERLSAELQTQTDPRYIQAQDEKIHF